MSRDPHTLGDVTLSYVLGELDPPDAAAFERELAADATLAAEVHELRRAFAALPYATLTDPPPGLRARVLAAAEHDEAVRGPAAVTTLDTARRTSRPGAPEASTREHVGASARRTARSRSWWPAATTALAAGLAIMFAVDARHLRQELALQREVTDLLQQPNVVVSFALTGTGTAGSAYGNVALDMDAARGALAMRALPAAPSGHVYRLWAVSAGKNVLCGQFNADTEHAARAQFVVPVHAYEGRVEKVFVTLEPLADTPQPTGPRVLESL
jgi:Anti-sigma-K factor rskA, C-terminal